MLPQEVTENLIRVLALEETDMWLRMYGMEEPTQARAFHQKLEGNLAPIILLDDENIVELMNAAKEKAINMCIELAMIIDFEDNIDENIDSSTQKKSYS